ncbi:MAG TPA: hypothetical protein VGN95_25285 [Pyrinomonadaceae bacterium]|jgi:hypothetical protein|nr:hypothetical protein [Pyrinomonadaceae bacterium]
MPRQNKRQAIVPQGQLVNLSSYRKSEPRASHPSHPKGNLPTMGVSKQHAVRPGFDVALRRAA